MNCRKCGHDFCWMCLGLWKEHGSKTGGYYSCNVYDDKKKNDKAFQEGESAMAQSANELHRYTWHYERYNNHAKSREIALKQRPKIKENAKLLNEVKHYPSKELEFFDECCD